ncbi:MAG TPA: SCP2 sterol-binding domain-containing protein [Acidimicrobiales bacterium]|jgi:putative sterol carrier protein
MSPGASWLWAVPAAGSGVSVMVRHPWTALLSRGRYDGPVRAHPMFREANLVVSGGWTLYFGLAAVTTALTGRWWVSLAFVLPTPLLGRLSFRVGDGYASWKMGHLGEMETTNAMTKGTMAVSTSSQDELRTMIVDKSDEEILVLMQQAPGGIPGVLDATVAGMAEALDPDTAMDCVVGYEIDSGNENFAYRVEVRGREVQAERREPSDARVVLQLNVPEYLRLVTGLLDGTEAFLAGRMKIRGDVMFAPQIGRMFVTG